MSTGVNEGASPWIRWRAGAFRNPDPGRGAGLWRANQAGERRGTCFARRSRPRARGLLRPALTMRVRLTGTLVRGIWTGRPFRSKAGPPRRWYVVLGVPDGNQGTRGTDHDRCPTAGRRLSGSRRRDLDPYPGEPIGPHDLQDPEDRR